jgi:hypothetical protein
MLISSATTLPALDQNPRLRFWHWYDFNAGDTGTVYIKVVGTSAWEKISTGYFHTGSEVWSYPSIDLGNYAGQDVQIAFFFHSQQVGSFGNVSTGWYIDDVIIDDNTDLSVNAGADTAINQVLHRYLMLRRAEALHL